METSWQTPKLGLWQSLVASAQSLARRSRQRDSNQRAPSAAAEQAVSVDEVTTALTEWRPHLAILDMDLDSARIMALLAAIPVGGMRLPVIGVTRRGDLKRESWPRSELVPTIFSRPVCSRGTARARDCARATRLLRRGDLYARHQAGR